MKCNQKKLLRLLAIALALALGAPVAAAQKGDVLVGTYTYGWIGADFDQACGLLGDAVVTRTRLATATFDAAGNAVLVVDEHTACPGGGSESGTQTINATYTLDEFGELYLDLDPSAPGTETGTLLMTWDRGLGIELLEEDDDEPGLGVLVRNGNGPASGDLLGEYALSRVTQSQVGGGIDTRVDFGSITFQVGGQYAQTTDWWRLDPLGSSGGSGATASGTWTVHADGTLALDGTAHEGVVGPDGRYAFVLRRAGATTALTLMVRKPTSPPTPGAFDDLWWFGEYGADRDIAGGGTLNPESGSGMLSADAQSQLMLVGSTEISVDAFGGDSSSEWGLVDFVPGGDGSYVFDTPAPGPVPGWIAESEDVAIFATLGDPEIATIGIAPRAWGPLTGDVESISIAAGGVQELTIRNGWAHAGKAYLVLGSITGTYPGIPAGSDVIPLVFDPYTQVTLASPNQPPLGGTFGALDGLGAAVATFALGPGASPALVGTTAYHACAVLDPALPGLVALASNPVSLAFTP